MSDYTILRADEAPDFTRRSRPFLATAGRSAPSRSRSTCACWRRAPPHVPPGGDPAGGHHHKTIEEIYFVIDGEIEIKLGDDVHTLRARDAVLIGAGTRAATRNPTDAEAAFAMISVKVEDPMAESVPAEGFWPTG